jgi:molecular chaperone DnaK
MFTIGIDLGTSNTAAAVTIVSGEKCQTVLIPLSGNKIRNSLKSSVIFGESDIMFTGSEADKMLKKYPDGYTSGFKVQMGSEYLYRANGKFHSPVELSAIILERVKKIAEEYMHDRIRDAVIAVPAYFNHNQRNATREAAAIAGLKVKQLVSEPTAVAISYWNSKPAPGAKNILVFDMGSGTTDVSIIRAESKNFSVLGTYGNTKFGGRDMDIKIEDMMKSFLRQNKTVTYPPDIRNHAEKLKIYLSTHESGDSILGNQKIKYSMTSKQLNKIVADMLPEVYNCIDKAISNSGISRNNLDIAIITGGPTRIPFLFNSIENYLSIKAQGNSNSETAVAIGASILASGFINIDHGQISKIKVNDVVPISLGSVTLNDIVITMIPSNTPVPCKMTRPFTTIKDYQSEIEVKVVQGERPLGKDNIVLGNFRLSGLKPAPRGEVSIDVTYSVDKNGILTVSAKDNDTGSKKEIQIKESMQHTPEEIKEMKDAVKKYFKADSDRKKMAEIMNRSEQLLHELKNIANMQLSNGTKYYNINTDILMVSKAIKNNNIKLLSQLLTKMEKEYSLKV